MESPHKVNKIMSILNDSNSNMSLVFSEEYNNPKGTKSNVYRSNDTFKRLVQRNRASQISLSTNVTNRLYVPSEKTIGHIRAERESQYFDRTPGPDHYQTINPLGAKAITSRQKNVPSFTIRKRNDRNNN